MDLYKSMYLAQRLTMICGHEINWTSVGRYLIQRLILISECKLAQRWQVFNTTADLEF